MDLQTQQHDMTLTGSLVKYWLQMMKTWSKNVFIYRSHFLLEFGSEQEQYLFF